MSMSIALGLPEPNNSVTALVTDETIPPLFFLAGVPEPLPDEALLPLPEDFLAAVVLVPVERAVPLDRLAPPDAVRLPAPPLFVAVEVFEPPDFEAVAERAVEAFEPAFLFVPVDLDAPLLVIPELFEVELLLEPPVFAVADFLPPWLDLEVDLVDELFAVAICYFSKYGLIRP